jgi:hypothetical protein
MHEHDGKKLHIKLAQKLLEPRTTYSRVWGVSISRFVRGTPTKSWAVLIGSKKVSPRANGLAYRDANAQ